MWKKLILFKCIDPRKIYASSVLYRILYTILKNKLQKNKIGNYCFKGFFGQCYNFSLC